MIGYIIIAISLFVLWGLALGAVYKEERWARMHKDFVEKQRERK